VIDKIPDTPEGNAFRRAFYHLSIQCMCDDCIVRYWPLWEAAIRFANSGEVKP
jgi:hypothetical protein